MLKHRLSKEGSQLVTDCNQLKMASSHGKTYKTEMDSEQILRLSWLVNVINRRTLVHKFLLFLCLFFTVTNAAQFKEKDFKDIPSRFKIVFETRENEKGLQVSYKDFKAGKITAASDREISNYMNTMLLGSGTFWFQYFTDNLDNFTYDVIKSNGFTSSKFTVLLKSDLIDVYMIRQLLYSSVLKNTKAAENPNNYGMIIAIDLKNSPESSSVYIEKYEMFVKSNNIKLERGISR